MSISFDFTSIKNRIITSLQGKESWAKLISFGVDDTLLDSVVEEMVRQVQYKEINTFENWWGKARNRSSLLVEAPVHGYEVPRKKGGKGTCRVSVSETFDSSHSENIPIPKYFEVSNGDIFVVSDDNYILPANENYLDFEVNQGTKQFIQFQAQGLEFETKIVYDINVDNDLYDLYVNDILWTKVDSLFNYSSNDTVYEIFVPASLDHIILKFGNNVFGKKLLENDDVKFYYASTLGKSGDITSINSIDTIESQAYDVLGNPITLFVTNITPILGGRDFPSIEEIRNISPKVFQSGDRNTAKPDYEITFDKYQFISKSNVWGALEYLQDNNLDIFSFIPTNENVVHICALNNEYNDLTQEQKTDIVLDIYNKSDPTDLFKFETTEKILIEIYGNIVLKNFTYILNTEKTNIEQVLNANYNIANTDYEQNIDYSNFITLIDSIPSVKNHNSFIKIVSLNTFTEAYISNVFLPIFPIDGETIEVYIKLKTEDDSNYQLIGVGLDSGIITNYTSGIDLTGSLINVSNGVGTININSGLVLPFEDYDIKVSYKTLDNSVILTKRNQIISLNNIFLTVNYPSTI